MVTKSLTPNDDNQVRRIVGFLEYANALGYFEELVKSTSEKERAAIDEIISENGAFKVYTNLARRVQPSKTSLATYLKSNRPAKAESNQKDSSYSEGDPSQSGLTWAMALARVEFASILAAFTGNSDPYVAVRPTSYELPAYRELLLDAAAMHYWSLARDPGVKKARKISPANPAVLAYSRRMGMARKMASGLAHTSSGDLYPMQQRELASWEKNLGESHISILVMIEDYLAQSVSRSNSSTTELNHEFVDACTRQLAMERSQLRNGKATITRFDPPSSSSSN